MCCLASDRVWDSDRYKLILKTQRVYLHCLEESCICFSIGLHIVNNESKRIYIDRKCNIKKRTKDMKTNTTLRKKTFSKWRPLCAYWSLSNGDLLVGMCNYNTDYRDNYRRRYKQSGQQTKTIQYDNTGLGLY